MNITLEFGKSDQMFESRLVKTACRDKSANQTAQYLIN